MPLDVKCAGCKAAFKVKDEHAGKKMKCPKCGKIITIPKKDDEVIEDVEVVEEEPASEESPGNLFDFEDQLGQPRGKKEKAAQKPPEQPKGPTWGKYIACPSCGGREAKRVKWTWWGSFYGPKLFTHVRCVDCGFAFNGKTGDSNIVPMVLFVVIPLVLLIIVLTFIVVLLIRTDNWPPWKKFLSKPEAAAFERDERGQSWPR
jgi:predicted Zn finger-like uncharacterized protein